MASGEFAVRIDFRNDQDGRCYISSPDLIGLHLAGDDLDVLRRELDTIIKDLVWHNLNRVIDEIRWVPNLDEITAKYHASQKSVAATHTEVCVMQLATAA